MSDTAQEIKNRLDVAEVLRGYITLTPAGKNLKARCPFHKEKSPSFMISPERQSWHCFGCGEGGDIFTFLMKFENIEFFEALKILAERAGVELSAHEGAGDAYKNIYDLNRIAKDFFCGNFSAVSPTAHQTSAVKYLKERGLKDETIKEFEIGLASTASDALLRHLVQSKKSVSEAEKAGLIIKTERGTYWDRFRGRLMFPLYNNFGKVVGFTGRVLPQEMMPAPETAKYVNSPETPIFSKSKILYGFHKAKNHIREARTAVIVEGQMDFLMSWQDGLKNVIASSGTALTPDHLVILRRVADNLVLSFDADDAGQAAAERSIDLANNFDFNVKILEIHGGKDPADVVLQSPGKMAEYISAAKPAMEWYFGRYLKDKENIGVFKKNIRVVLGKLKSIASAVERDYWLRELSARAGVPESTLTEEMGSLKIEKNLQPATFVSAKPVEFEKADRKTVIAERIMGLLAACPEFYIEAVSCRNYFDERYRLLYDSFDNGKFSTVAEPLKPLADLISMRSGLVSEELLKSDPKHELSKLMKELKGEYIKDRQRELRGLIADFEKQGKDKELGAALKEFDSISKELHNVNNQGVR